MLLLDKGEQVRDSAAGFLRGFGGLVSEGGSDYRIEVPLKGALYKMVRNMVDVALDVARGRYDSGHVRRLLIVVAEGETVSGKKAPTGSEKPSKRGDEERK